MAHNKNPGAGATAHGAGDDDAGKHLIASPKPRARKARLVDWLKRARVTRTPAGHLVMDMKAAGHELPQLRSLNGLPQSPRRLLRRDASRADRMAPILAEAAVSTMRRGAKSDRRASKAACFELTRQFRREWLERTRSTDRFCTTPNPEKENSHARQSSKS